MSIEILSNDKKETSINYIVQQGIVTPTVSWANVKDRMKICDIRTAFYGINDCIFLGIMISAIFWLLFFQVDTKLIGCGVYLLSPLVYIVIYSLVVWKEMVFDLYEMKMVCKYNLQRLSSVRMLYFSMISLAWNSIAILFVQPVGVRGADFMNLLGISFASTFLYGIAIIFFRWRGKTVISQLICSGVWVGANVLFICFDGRSFEKLLMALPRYIVAIIVCASSMVYLSMLLFNTLKRIEGEKEYAFNQ